MLNPPRSSLGKEAYTDMEGYYELFDLPAGSVSISLMSSAANGSRNLAQKRIKLQKGQSVELNFGDEVGFTLSGVVRIGNKAIEKAQVEIYIPNKLTKWGYSDREGRFLISGIPEGTHTINTSYRLDFEPKTSKWGSEQWLRDGIRINVDRDVEIDIDFGDGSVSGEIPQRFMKRENFQIMAQRWAPKEPRDYILLPRNWEYEEYARIDSEGKFTLPNLRAGRYYLLLSSDRETLCITDLFELGESEHIDNMTFNIGKGALEINVVDADTSQGISSTSFSIRNDLEASFYSKKWVPEGQRGVMVTDDNGRAEYSALPDGNYVVGAIALGYLTGESEWVKVSDDEITPVTISLEPAAVVRFELDSELQKWITGEYIYLRCQVSNTKTGDILNSRREDAEHMVWLTPEDASIYRQPVLNLPEGQYQIEYRLYQDKKGGRLSYKTSPPLLEGTVNVELKKRETKLITVSE